MKAMNISPLSRFETSRAKDIFLASVYRVCSLTYSMNTCIVIYTVFNVLTYKKHLLSCSLTM